MDQNQDSISLYKPVIDVGSLFAIDETLPVNELAFAVLQTLVRARKTQDALFLVIGKMLKLVKDKKLHKNYDFDTFEQFLASEEVAFSREKAYLYIRIYEMFVQRFQMKEKDLTDLGVARLQALVPVLKEITDRDEALAKIEELGGSSIRFNEFIRATRNLTNTDGKPTVFWSDEASKWIIQYFNDKTNLIDMGKFADRTEELGK